MFGDGVGGQLIGGEEMKEEGMLVQSFDEGSFAVAVRERTDLRL